MWRRRQERHETRFYKHNMYNVKKGYLDEHKRCENP